METKLETTGTAIYRGNVKIAQCLDKDAGELFGENILPREKYRELLQTYEQAAASADMLVYRANHYHELRQQRDELLAALIDLTSDRYPQALRDGEYWAMQAATNARAGIAKARGRGTK